jgi:hypothetical protein
MGSNYWDRMLATRVGRRRALVLGGGALTAALIGVSAAGGAQASLGQPNLAGPRSRRFEVPSHRIAVRSETVLPRETDARIDVALEPHYVVFPGGALRNRLFLFFHSTGNFTDDYYLIADQAARNGLHAINLRYFSAGGVVADVCRGVADQACAENLRAEQLTGENVSAQFAVNRTNSIENRLVSLLSHLDQRFPDSGWGAYLEAGVPAWSRIVVAGHSQGTNVAAFLAREYRVARVAMFAGPTESGNAAGRQPVAQPSAWLLGPHATPSDRYFAFGHSLDAQINLQAQWAAIKLGMDRFGPPVNVDNSPLEFEGSHLLLTDAKAAPPKKPVIPNHGTTIRDDVTPKLLNGQPLFAPVWQYMCFA